jgi:hypothetical protein
MKSFSVEGTYAPLDSRLRGNDGAENLNGRNPALPPPERTLMIFPRRPKLPYKLRIKTSGLGESFLKYFPTVAVLVGAFWGYYMFYLGGSSDWISNITIQTQVFPYRDNLRLVVVHVKTKNPRPVAFEINHKNGIFVLHAKKIAPNLTVNTVIDEDDGIFLKDVDLIPGDRDGSYKWLPNAEYDDMQTFVVETGTILSFSAEMQRGSSPTDPENDFISASTIVRVEP